LGGHLLVFPKSFTRKWGNLWGVGVLTLGVPLGVLGETWERDLRPKLFVGRELSYSRWTLNFDS